MKDIDSIWAFIAGVGLTVISSYIRDAIRAALSATGRKLKIFGATVVWPGVARILAEMDDLRRQSEGNESMKARLAAMAVYNYLDCLWCSVLAIPLAIAGVWLWENHFVVSLVSLACTAMLTIVAWVRGLYGQWLYRAAVSPQPMAMIGLSIPFKAAAKQEGEDASA